MNSKIKKVKVPKGQFCSRCCGDCIYLNMEKKSYGGQYWCAKKDDYRNSYENAEYCSYYSAK